jgi:hypothetical protein
MGRTKWGKKPTEPFSRCIQSWKKQMKPATQSIKNSLGSGKKTDHWFCSEGAPSRRQRAAAGEAPAGIDEKIKQKPPFSFQKTSFLKRKRLGRSKEKEKERFLT